MEKKHTNRVSRLLVDAREDGIISWDWIVDEHREAERQPGWNDPDAFAECVVYSYRKDRWSNQPSVVEVWSEKGTVRGTLAPVLKEYGVTLRVIHGFDSASAVYQAAQEAAGDNRGWTILYVGDFDPSGMFISHVDLPGRLVRYGFPGEVRRIALTIADRDGADPRMTFSADTKNLDKRYQWYVEQYGKRCLELDAMDPRILRDRVEGAICEYIEWGAWNRAAACEAHEQETLKTVIGNWARKLRLA